MQGKIEEGLKQAEDDYDKEQNEIKYWQGTVTGGNKTEATNETQKAKLNRKHTNERLSK